MAPEKFRDFRETGPWRGNLRLIRSHNDMHIAVPKPPVFPIVDLRKARSYAGQAEKWSSEELQDDNVVWQSEENVTAITATYL